MRDELSSDELRRAISALMNDVATGAIDLGGPTDLARDLRAAVSMRILPVVWDMGGVFALREDGTVVSYEWDLPGAIEVETSMRMQNAIRFAAAKKFGLSILARRRNPEAVDCSHCNGTGQPTGVDLSIIPNARCYCGGVGWLPTEEA